MQQTKFTCDFSEEIWKETYKYHTDDSVSGSHLRVAKDLASTEKHPEEWTEKFYDALTDFKLVPGGRITSNAGTSLHGTTYINCFVDGPVVDDKDSIAGIFNAVTRAALTLKSEGGYGFCCDFIRPRGSFIHGVGVETPGAVEMLKLWDVTSEVITKGAGQKKKKKEGKNKIRKGAMMVTMSCWHPDIEEFITAKSVAGQLTKFNMSGLIYNKFIEAVEKDDNWDLIYPDTTDKDYKKEWDGNIGKWIADGRSIVVHKTVKARDLWEKIMSATYNRNEPGVLFADRMNELNNLAYCEFISSTNPCGEQLLPIGGVCLLGSINLTQFVNKSRTDWDYAKLKEQIPTFVRFLDNVNDKTLVPLPEQKWNLENKRRIGLGYLGYGSALYIMKVRYGSKHALELTDKLTHFVTNQAYQASAMIAAEKGAFPLFDRDKYLASKFVKQALDKDTVDLIAKHGIRNSHLTSIQPTGNGSVYANNVSSGLEPVVNAEYVRTSVVQTPPDEMELPKVDWTGKSIANKTSQTWKWIREGDEDLLATKFNGVIYKFDRNRGLTKETAVEDYGVRILKELGEWDPKAEWAANINNLNIREHVDTMKVFAKHIDSAMSKTINLPNDYPYDEFKSLYMDMFKSGVIKGGTTYRHGTMTTVISTEKTNLDLSGRPTTIVPTDAPKRPEVLPCEVHHVSVRGIKWVVLVGLLAGKPYEMFAGEAEQLELPSKYKGGLIVKIKQGHYNLHLGEGDDELVVKNLIRVFDNSNNAWATRMISMTLRHGASPAFVCEQLNKDGLITDINKVLARVLKKYIEDGQSTGIKCQECGSDNVVFEEGCSKCLNCGSSKCG